MCTCYVDSRPTSTGSMCSLDLDLPVGARARATLIKVDLAT